MLCKALVTSFLRLIAGVGEGDNCQQLRSEIIMWVHDDDPSEQRSLEYLGKEFHKRIIMDQFKSRNTY